MNEQANKQLVQQAYQSVKAGDVQSLLNSLAEDVQWHFVIPNLAREVPTK
jgi:ketosteroid isomerase-like protein